MSVPVTSGIDPLASPALHAAFPGLATVLDDGAMSGVIESALGLTQRPEACRVTQTSYVGDWCVLRYDVTVDGRRLLVTGRMFADEPQCAAYVTDTLEPVAGRARPVIDPVVRHPVAEVGPLRLALSVFPVDGELPSLVVAADMAQMHDVLRAAVRRLLGVDVDLVHGRVETGHYGRRHRCVLRYVLRVGDGRSSGRRVVIYGKVADDDSLERSVRAVADVRESVPDVVTAPMPLDYVPALRLALFEELPGVPCIAQLVRSAITGIPTQLPEAPPLSQAVIAAARIAAALHTSGIDHPPTRPLTSDVAAIRRLINLLRPMSPGLAERLDGHLHSAEARAADTAPGPLVFSHGDYSYTQLLFAGDRAALVDFDTVCRAEPALDVGHFLAYLDLAGRKSDRPSTSVVADVGARFRSAYADASAWGDLASLSERVAVYRTISLVRLAAHAWQKLKARRLGLVLDALDERG